MHPFHMKWADKGDNTVKCIKNSEHVLNVVMEVLNLLAEMYDSEKFLKLMGSDAKALNIYVEKAWNIRTDHLYTI